MDRRPHLIHLHSVLFTGTQFFLTTPLFQIFQIPYNIMVFHSAVSTAIKMLIVNLLLFPKALSEPELFFIESACPGDMAKPAFDQCLILVDAQGCVG